MGDCFPVAWRIVDQGDGRDVLCHGEPIGRGGDALGVRFAHAWVERDGQAIDRANGLDISLPVATYYALGRIVPEHVHRYSQTDARRAALFEETYGPWHEPARPDWSRFGLVDVEAEEAQR